MTIATEFTLMKTLKSKCSHNKIKAEIVYALNPFTLILQSMEQDKSRWPERGNSLTALTPLNKNITMNMYAFSFPEYVFQYHISFASTVVLLSFCAKAQQQFYISQDAPMNRL